MKVLFLVGRVDTPSTRWRVLQFIPHLGRLGVDCRVEEIPAGMMAKLAAAKGAAAYDVVVLQKRLLPRLVSTRLRRHARRLVFEFDDSVTVKKSADVVRVSATRERRFRRIVREADAVITTNDHLAEQARRLAADPGRVRILPTAIDLSRWTVRGPAGREWPYVVGWMGSEANLPQLGVVQPALRRMCRRHKDLSLRVVCDAPPGGLEGVRVEHRTFSADREVADIRSFDLAIAPMVEDPWTQGKVSTKILAYAAAGVPTVASDVGAHRVYIRDGENGFLAGTLTQWEERMEQLLADPALRDAVGARARERVEREYSLDAMVPRYAALLRELAGA